MPDKFKNPCLKVMKGEIIPASELEKRRNNGSRVDQFQNWLTDRLKDLIRRCCPSIPALAYKKKLNETLELSPNVEFNKENVVFKVQRKKSYWDEDHLNCPVCTCSAIELDVNNALKSNRRSCVRNQSPKQPSFKSHSMPVLSSAFDFSDKKITFAGIFGDLSIFGEEKTEKIDEFDYFSDYSSFDETHGSSSSYSFDEDPCEKNTKF